MTRRSVVHPWRSRGSPRIGGQSVASLAGCGLLSAPDVCRMDCRSPHPQTHTHGAVASLSGLQISPPFAARSCKCYEVGFIIFLFSILKLLRICHTLQSLPAPSSLQKRAAVIFFSHVLCRAALLCQVAPGQTEFLHVFPEII